MKRTGRRGRQIVLTAALAILFYNLLGLLMEDNGAQRPANAQRAGDAAAGEPQDGPPPGRKDVPLDQQLEEIRAGDRTELRLLHATVGDDDLPGIEPLHGLRRINLPRSRLTDAALAKFAELPELIQLRIGSPQITDDGMHHVAHMRKLRFLHLIDVPITDAGLVPLHKMTWLESFYIDGGNVTDDGLSRLLEKLPKLHLHRDQLHLPDHPHHRHHGHRPRPAKPAAIVASGGRIP